MKHDKPVLKASKEIGESILDAANLASGVEEALDEVGKLRDRGYGGAGDGMIKLGAALVMFPEPFMITDVAGAGIIGAGILYNHAVPPPLYIDDIAETIREQIVEIGKTGREIDEMRLTKPGNTGA